MKYEFNTVVEEVNNNEVNYLWKKMLVVNNLTMDGLVERIHDVCSFYPLILKCMDYVKDWVDLKRDDTESSPDMF